jgi:hypothetical protein
VDIDDLFELAKEITVAGKTLNAKLERAGPLIKGLLSAPWEILVMGATIRKLQRTVKVMAHKNATVVERVKQVRRQEQTGTKTRDLAAVRDALRVQLDVVKLANKQADILLKQLSTKGN